jgi:hypothetical protein
MSTSAPPRELVIDAKPAPGDSNDGAGAGMAPFAIPVLAAGFLAKFVSGTAALVALGVAVVALVARRKPREGRFVLRVTDGALEVTRERGVGPAVRVALADLLDVTLDKEARPAGRGGSASERVRLALERREPADPIFVPDDRLSPLEAQDWYSKVRVFLRKHGWVPKDERDVGVAAPPPVS